MVVSSQVKIEMHITHGVTATITYQVIGSDTVHHHLTLIGAEKSTVKFKGTIQNSSYTTLNLALVPGESANIEAILQAIISNQQELVLKTEQNHLDSRSSSSLVTKCVGQGTGKIIFDGHIVVGQDSRDTVSSLQADFLRVDPTVHITAQPTLAIATKSVEACKHACTIKGIDKDIFFYAQSRGISVAEIKQLLIHSFLII